MMAVLRNISRISQGGLREDSRFPRSLASQNLVTRGSFGEVEVSGYDDGKIARLFGLIRFDKSLGTVLLAHARRDDQSEY